MTIPVNGLATSGFVEPTKADGHSNGLAHGHVEANLGEHDSVTAPLKTVLTEHDTPVAAHDESWQAIAARKQAGREALLRQDARVASSSIARNSSTLAQTSALLTDREIDIISLPAYSLAERIADRGYTSYEVTLAYCKSATIAQDATNCLTELCFEEGLARARELDAFLEKQGRTVGPLHGIPVSIKDHIDVKGLDASTGFVGWAYEKYAEKDAVVVRCVREAGGVICCKTANPQSLLAIETNNNIFGRTTNPFDSQLSAGGSSGGEGALIAMKGSPLGVGTDIAGSIRIPALWNGIYGLRPSVARMPHTGLQGPHEGMDTLMGVVGPMARSLLDLDLFCSAVNSREPWHYEAQQIAKPWAKLNLDATRKLTIGVMIDDGIVAPHPPIAAAMQSAIAKLKAAGHDIVDWNPLRAAESDELLFALCLQDRGDEYRQHLELSGEPAIPGIEWLLREKAPPQAITHPYDLWKLVRVREILRQNGVDQWSAFPKLDAILCPGAPTLAPPHDTSRHWGYTSMWNILDWPAVTFPVDTPSEEDIHRVPWPPHAPRNETERFVWSTWSDETFRDAPVGLQLVGRRLEEEKLLEDLWIVERAFDTST